MLIRIALLLLTLTTFGIAQPAPQQPQLLTESQILGNIISQQSQENARLVVQLNQMQQAMQRMQVDLAKEKARADAAEAKLPKTE